MNLENMSLLSYNTAMSKTAEPILQIDLAALCKDLESVTGQSPAQVAESLNFKIKSYYHWRNGDREPDGQATAKLFLYVRKLETESNIKIPLKFKQ